MNDARPLDWDDLRLFLVVARRPSLRLAAEALGTSAATLSRHIAALEERLGIGLFARRASGLELSLAGERILARCEEIERLVARVATPHRTNAAEREVHVACVSALAGLVVPALARFRVERPAVKIVFVTGGENEREAHEADIALRLTRPRKGSFSARRLATLPVGVYGTADVAARAGEAPLVLWGASGAPASRSDGLLEERCADRPVAFRSRDFASVLAALSAGLGIGVLPDIAARAHRELVRVSPGGGLGVGAGESWPAQEAWLVLREDAPAHPDVRTLAAFLARAVATDVRAERRRGVVRIGAQA